MSHGMSSVLSSYHPSFPQLSKDTLLSCSEDKGKAGTWNAGHLNFTPGYEGWACWSQDFLCYSAKTQGRISLSRRAQEALTRCGYMYLCLWQGVYVSSGFLGRILSQGKSNSINKNRCHHRHYLMTLGCLFGDTRRKGSTAFLLVVHGLVLGDLKYLRWEEFLMNFVT